MTQYNSRITDCAVPIDCTADEKIAKVSEHTLGSFNEKQDKAREAATHAGIKLILGPPVPVRVHVQWP